MSMADLQQEYEAKVIGEGILGLLDELTWSVTRKYDPRIYGGGSSWADAHEDLLHSFVVEVLLEQGQLEYAIFVADTEEHFKNILARQLRFFLARRRQRTIIDNLLDRCKKITSEAPFGQGAETGAWWYELLEWPGPKRRPTADEIAQIAGELAVMPTQTATGTARAPQVYTTPDLKRVLYQVASRLSCRVAVRDLDEIFRRLLTPWLPSFLETDEGVLATEPSARLDAEQEDMARQAATAIQRAGTPVELGVLAMKIADVSDSVIGQHYKMSRPTVIKHKNSVLAKVEAELTGLSEACQKRAIELLSALLQEGRDAS
jgi:hypothetical protein